MSYREPARRKEFPLPKSPIEPIERKPIWPAVKKIFTDSYGVRTWVKVTGFLLAIAFLTTVPVYAIMQVEEGISIERCEARCKALKLRPVYDGGCRCEGEDRIIFFSLNDEAHEVRR